MDAIHDPDSTGRAGQGGPGQRMSPVPPMLAGPTAHQSSTDGAKRSPDGDGIATKVSSSEGTFEDPHSYHLDLESSATEDGKRIG